MSCNNEQLHLLFDIQHCIARVFDSIDNSDDTERLGRAIQSCNDLKFLLRRFSEIDGPIQARTRRPRRETA